MYSPVRKLQIPGIKCPSGLWEIKNDIQIGAESMYGSIYNACCENNCDHIAKIIPYSNTSLRHIKKELEIQDTVYRANPELTIPILDWYKDEEKAIIILPLLYETVREELTDMDNLEEMTELLQQVLNKTFYLHSLGVYHGDAHMNNFMLDKDGDVKLIDFGKSWYIDNPNRMLEDYQDIYTSVSSMFDGFNSEQRSMLEKIGMGIENVIENIDMKIRMQNLGSNAPIELSDIQLGLQHSDSLDFTDFDLPDVPSGLPTL